MREVAGDVVPDGVRERRRVRLEGLHDHAARGVAPAPAGELRHELERALLGAEVREREPRIGVDDRGDLDAGEVVALRHHLRPDEHGRARRREALERLAERAVARCRVRVQADPLQPGQPPLELCVEPLRPGSDACQLDRAALGARLRHLDRVAAVMAVKPRVGVQRQRDVAAAAASRHAARAAVDGARDSPAVQEENRAPAAFLDRRELCEKRRRQRVASLAAEVDELHRRHRRADPRRERETLEARPALRPRRRAPVDGDRPLERRALRRDRARVVARIGLLLERRVVLLVDDDEAELAESARRPPSARPTTTGASPATMRSRSSRRSASVKRGVEHGDAVAEPRAEAAYRLRRERDLGDEHDDAAVARERGRRSLEVHLGLPASGRPVQQDMTSVAVQRADDPLDARTLRRRQLGGLGLAAERIPCGRLATRASPRSGMRSDESQRARRSRAVVVGQPEREIDEWRRDPVDDRARVGDLDPVGRIDVHIDDDAANAPPAEPDRHDVAARHVLRYAIRERPRERTGGDEGKDLCERHPGERIREVGDGTVTISRRADEL